MVRHRTPLIPKGLFTTYVDYDGRAGVANGLQLHIVGRGTVRIPVQTVDGATISVVLHDVLHIPALQFHLFSVAAALRVDRHKIVSVENDSWTLSTHSGLIKLPFDSTSGLFLLQPSTPSSVDGTILVTRSSTETTMLWHHRLGHTSHDKLRILRRHSNLFDFPMSRQAISAHADCDTCRRSKAKVLPYSKRKLPKADRPLQRVHTDIWGPINIPTISGHVYFISFTDECARKIFTYLMRSRSELYSVYEELRRDVRTRYKIEIGELVYHYSVPSDIDEIRALQMDNAGEYLRLGKLIHQKYGTLSTYTNAYTPTQNPIAERRMGLLITRVRSMLLHGNLPQFLWGEALKHATFLENITPSSTLEGDTPYRFWYQSHPDYGRLRVFGCVAYAHVNPPLRHNKLSQRGMLCMYLGVSDTCRGFRLMNVDTHCVFTSRDVTFVEHRFPTLKTVEEVARLKAVNPYRNCFTVDGVPPTQPPVSRDENGDFPPSYQFPAPRPSIGEAGDASITVQTPSTHAEHVDKQYTIISILSPSTQNWGGWQFCHSFHWGGYFYSGSHTSVDVSSYHYRFKCDYSFREALSQPRHSLVIV